MELHHLRSFVESVRLGSFNAAAQALNYTGPAISQHVAALEQELGVTLLTRHARGVVPTVAGEVLDERSRWLLDLAEGVAHEVRVAARAPSTVRIGAFSTAARQRAIRRRAGAFPGRGPRWHRCSHRRAG